MRSEVVFRASQRSEGRYHLCMLCAKATRAIHKTSGRIQDTINTAFGMIGQDGGHLQKKSLSDLQLKQFHSEEQNLAIERWTRWPV